VRLTGQRVETFLRQPDPAIAVAFLYGPDGGLVGERAERLGKLVVQDLDDPFRVSEVTGEQLEAEPQRLVEEAQALCMMGGRRFVRVRQATERSVKALELLLEVDRPEAFVAIEAGELATGSKLRQLAERSPKVAAIGCYREDARDLQGTIRTVLQELGLRPDADALAYLAQNLGADRGVTRRELEKLALYVGDAGERRVTLADAAAVVGDGAALGIDELVVAVLRRDPARLDRALGRLLSEGEAPVRLIRAVALQMLRLVRFQAEVEQGASPDGVVDGAKPPVHFSMKPVLKAALRQWPGRRLMRALTMLQEAELTMKRAASPDDLVCRHALAELIADGADRKVGPPGAGHARA
jgi:DNA polymerase-3 subunit delta